MLASSKLKMQKKMGMWKVDLFFCLFVLFLFFQCVTVSYNQEEAAGQDCPWGLLSEHIFT